MGKTRHLATTVLATVGIALGTLVGTPAPASAANTMGVVKVSGVLNVRMGPSTVTARTSGLTNGLRLAIMCQVAGQKIYGTVRTTNMWNRLSGGRYASDAYFVRPNARIPLCAATGGQVSPPASRPDTAVSRYGWTAPVPGAAGSGFRSVSRPTHDGVDVAVPKGTPLHAAAAGKVIGVYCNVPKGYSCDQDGSVKISGCGWYLEIAHAARVVTRYCHLMRRPSVTVGQTVNAGQQIGVTGSSGNSSGPHLHFEVHTNAPPATSANAVNPVTFLKSKGVLFR
ncbi:MAG TPA: peptidoglycan DD-metalloendopeptidase family protein [Pilimelia sp.]|nr:peptidoglycan DD-metalloendopeptidase family protein [Pilimelia sp.]